MNKIEQSRNNIQVQKARIQDIQKRMQRLLVNIGIKGATNGQVERMGTLIRHMNHAQDELGRLEGSFLRRVGRALGVCA